MCAALRTIICTCPIICGEIAGCSQRKIGPMIREVCSADIRSVEPMKMSPIQINTGAQYLKSFEMCIGFGSASKMDALQLL
jgi:hypothetical protein